MFLLPCAQYTLYQTGEYIFISQVHRHWISTHNKDIKGIVIDTKIRYSDMLSHYVVFNGAGFQPVPDYFIDIETQEIRYFGYL